MVGFEASGVAGGWSARLMRYEDPHQIASTISDPFANQRTPFEIGMSAFSPTFALIMMVLQRPFHNLCLFWRMKKVYPAGWQAPKRCVPGGELWSLVRLAAKDRIVSICPYYEHFACYPERVCGRVRAGRKVHYESRRTSNRIDGKILAVEDYGLSNIRMYAS